MIENPSREQQNDGAEIKESSPANLSSSHSVTAKGQEEAEEKSNAAGYGGYIAWPFVIIWKFVILPVFRFLDRHNASVSAVATVAIVALTFVYVKYSKKQWKVMSDQLNEMKQSNTNIANQIDLQRQIAASSVHAVWKYTTFSTDKTKQIEAVVSFENEGERTPQSLRVAAIVDFSSPPIERCPKFEHFIAKEPDQLLAHNKNTLFFHSNKISLGERHGAKNVYVCGEVVTTSFDITLAVPFCRSAPIDDVFNSPRKNKDGGHDYDSTGVCPPPQP